MISGKQSRMDRLFNRHGDGCAVCVAADHGYMSDVTSNVINLRSITEEVIRGGVDGILLSPGQAKRLAPLFQGRDGPALILRGDWMNSPRLGTTNVANSTPQRTLFHRKMVTAEQALALGASAITIYLFMGYNDDMEANGIEVCARFVRDCNHVGLPCIPVLVLGGARSDYERDAMELFAEALEAGGKGCLMGRNVTKSPNPERMVEQLTGIAHKSWSVDEALRGEVWDFVKLKAHPANCTGCNLCVVACVASHDNGDYGTKLSRLRIDAGKQLGQHKVMFCTLCKKCLDVCPTGALRWHPDTGAVELVSDLCENHGECVEICPTNVIIRSDEGVQISDGRTLDWFPVVCDLCGGEPECARICPTEAIFVAERTDFDPAAG